MGYRQFVKRLFPYLKNHIGKLFFTSLMMIFATVLETSIPEITGQVVDILFSNNHSSKAALSYSAALFIVIALSSVFALISVSASSWISSCPCIAPRPESNRNILKCVKQGCIYSGLGAKLRDSYLLFLWNVGHVMRGLNRIVDPYRTELA